MKKYIAGVSLSAAALLALAGVASGNGHLDGCRTETTVTITTPGQVQARSGPAPAPWIDVAHTFPIGTFTGVRVGANNSPIGDLDKCPESTTSSTTSSPMSTSTTSTTAPAGKSTTTTTEAQDHETTTTVIGTPATRSTVPPASVSPTTAVVATLPHTL